MLSALQLLSEKRPLREALDRERLLGDENQPNRVCFYVTFNIPRNCIAIRQRKYNGQFYPALVKCCEIHLNMNLYIPLTDSSNALISVPLPCVKRHLLMKMSITAE